MSEQWNGLKVWAGLSFGVLNFQVMMFMIFQIVLLSFGTEFQQSFLS